MAKKPARKMAAGGVMMQQGGGSSPTPVNGKDAFANAWKSAFSKRGTPDPQYGDKSGFAAKLFGSLQNAAKQRSDQKLAQSKAKPMKSGGKVRGAGCATRGVKGARSI